MLFHLFWANSGYDQSMFTILFSVPAIFCRYDWQFKVNFSILFINILFDQIPLYNILIENPVHCIITTCEKSVGFAVFCLFGFFFSGLVPRKLYGRTFVYIITFKISHFPQKHLFIFIKGFIRLVFLAKWGFLFELIRTTSIKQKIKLISMKADLLVRIRGFMQKIGYLL